MRKPLLIFLLLLAAFVVLAGASTAPSAAAGEFNLTILHTSENHGHWDPVVVSNVSQGGVARRATLIKDRRSKVPNLLLLDSGDVSQGTLYFVQYKGQEGRDLYNLLGYDAITLGNHEFDLGPKNLADNFLQGAKFGVTLANVDVSNEPTLAGKIPPYAIREVGGEKVGLFGLITDDLPTNSNAGPNVKMKNAVDTAKQVVADLTQQGVNKIILISHRGFPEDLRLAAQVDGIDLILSGHTETLMGDSKILDKSLGDPVSPYPAVVKTPNGGQTLIAHAFIWGRLLGEINLVFNDKGEVTSWTGAPIFVDKSIPDDPAVAQAVADLAKPLEALKKQIIGQTAVDLQGDSKVIRVTESNLGNLVADAMLWATAQDKTVVAITNGGGIRTSIPTGPVSYGQVLEVLPFGNRLVQFDLTGADVRAALENGVSSPGSGRFPQVAGLKFSGDWSKPAGARITEVQVGTAAGGFKPLDPAAVYRIVTNDFMAGGGDGYTVFKNGKEVRGGDVPIDEAVSNYIQANTPVNPKTEGRIALTGTPPVPTPTTAAAATPTKAPATKAPPPPTRPRQSACGELPPDTAALLYVNHFPGEATVTLTDHEYHIPGNSQLVIQVPAGKKFTIDAFIPGVGRLRPALGPFTWNPGDCFRLEPGN